MHVCALNKHGRCCVIEQLEWRKVSTRFISDGDVHVPFTENATTDNCAPVQRNLTLCSWMFSTIGKRGKVKRTEIGHNGKENLMDSNKTMCIMTILENNWF